MSVTNMARVPIRTAILLSRIPLIVPKETKFESTYRNYQLELERRLMWTFPSYYYFKKGTLSEHKFTSLQKKPVIKQPGVWYRKGIPDIRHGRERRMKQEIILPKQDTNESEKNDADNLSRAIVTNSVETEADRNNDLTSLERQLRKNLYLVVKGPDDKKWRFPSFDNESLEIPLDEIAEEGIRRIGGVNMNTWTVSKKPVCVLVNKGDRPFEFIIKSHILAGKFEPTDEKLKYKWLTKEEMKDYTDGAYFKNTEYLLD